MKVRAIDSFEGITEGLTYELVKGDQCWENRHHIVDDYGNKSVYSKTRFEPVEDQSECPFIPGETYKDIEGNTYRFISFEPEADKPHQCVFLDLKRKLIVTRLISGKIYNNIGALSNILPTPVDVCECCGQEKKS